MTAPTRRNDAACSSFGHLHPRVWQEAVTIRQEWLDVGPVHRARRPGNRAAVRDRHLRPDLPAPSPIRVGRLPRQGAAAGQRLAHAGRPLPLDPRPAPRAARRWPATWPRRPPGCGPRSAPVSRTPTRSCHRPESPARNGTLAGVCRPWRRWPAAYHWRWCSISASGDRCIAVWARDSGCRCGRRWARTLPVCWYGQQDACWLGYYDTLQRLGLADGPTPHTDHFGAWAGLARSCGWWWPGEGVCVLADRPAPGHVDAGAGRLARRGHADLRRLPRRLATHLVPPVQDLEGGARPPRRGPRAAGAAAGRRGPAGAARCCGG